VTVRWRPLRPHETDHETLWASVAAALGVMLVLWLRFVEWPPILCPLHAITGWPCPTCGATRAVLALARGEFVAALRMNPLVGAAALGAVPYLAYAAVVSVLGLPRCRIEFGPRAAAAGRVAAVAAVVTTWAFLIADGR
jgi:hypothetical protein